MRRHGQLVWLHQPDVYGLVADAHARLRVTAEAEEQALAEQVRRERERFERYRMEIPPRAARPAAQPLVANLPSWALHKKANRPFFGYRFTGRGAWVLFELADGRSAIRRLDGSALWFKELSHPDAAYDAALDLLVVPTFAHGQGLLRGQVEGTRISSDFTDMLLL